MKYSGINKNNICVIYIYTNTSKHRRALENVSMIIDDHRDVEKIPKNST